MMEHLHKDLLQHCTSVLDSKTFNRNVLETVTSILIRINAELNFEEIGRIIIANSDILGKVCEHVYNQTKVPLLEEGGYFKDDFTQHRKYVLVAMSFYVNAASVFISTKALDLELGSSAQISLFKKQLLVFGMLLSSEHMENSKAWSNEECMLCSSHLETTLSETIFDNSSVDVGIVGCNLQGKKCFIYIMDIIKKHTKQYGARAVGSLTSFKNLLLKFKSHEISDYVNDIFPTSLLLMDDYKPESKVSGVTCIQHVLKHASAAEMQLYGRSAVLYSALHKMLYTNEVYLLQTVLPTMLQVLRVEYGLPEWTKTFNSDNDCEHLHEVVQIVLYNMEMENNLQLRRIYVENLSPYIIAMGIRAVKHYNRLFRIIYSYMETHDGMQETSRILALTALDNLITHTWPRIPKYSGEIVKNLLKLVLDITDSNALVDSGARETILKSCSDCMKHLYLLDSEFVSATLNAVIDSPLPDEALKFCRAQLKINSESDQ